MAIENDLTEVLLALFVSWDQLLPLFQRHTARNETKRDACAHIWKIIEPTLSFHNRSFARNIELLRKSKEDSQIDAMLRRSFRIDELLPTSLGHHPCGPCVRTHLTHQSQGRTIGSGCNDVLVRFSNSHLATPKEIYWAS